LFIKTKELDECEKRLARGIADQKYAIQELTKDGQTVTKFMRHTRNEMTKMTYKEDFDQLQNELISKADQSALHELMANLNNDY